MDEKERKEEKATCDSPRRRCAVLLLSILGALALFTVLCFIFPDVFYHKFLYKYYIKSFIEDGGYNPIDTTTYGLMIAGALFAIYRLMKRLDIRWDAQAVYVVIPWMLIGGAYRALEDAEFFRAPVIYFFRSPMIYFTVAISGILVILYSVWVQVYSATRKNWLSGFLGSIALLAILNVLYLILYLTSYRGIAYRFTPVYPLVLSAMLAYPLYVDCRRRGRADMKTILFITGLFILLLSVLPIARWPGDASWKAYYLSVGYNTPPELKWGYFFLVVGLTLAVTLAIAGIFLLLRRRYPVLSAYHRPLSLLIIFAHLLDASATSIGIDFFGYTEKHFVPHFMINLTGTAFVMFLLKIPLVLLVVYVLDIVYGKEFEENKDLLNLVKMGIILLGLSPGTRDVLRMAMGV